MKNVCKEMTIIMNHENLTILRERGKGFKSSKMIEVMDWRTVRSGTARVTKGSGRGKENDNTRLLVYRPILQA